MRKHDIVRWKEIDGTILGCFGRLAVGTEVTQQGFRSFGRFIQRLVLAYGRWCYRRLAETTANFFYKVRLRDSTQTKRRYLCANFSVQNIVWTFTLFWFSIYTNFDGSYLFDFSYIVLVTLRSLRYPSSLWLFLIKMWMTRSLWLCNFS